MASLLLFYHTFHAWIDLYRRIGFQYYETVFQNPSSHITHPNIRNHHLTCENENSKNNHPEGRRPHPSLRDHPDMAVGSDRAVTHRDRQVLDGVKSLLV